MRFAYLCVLVCAVERWSVESTGVESEPGKHKYPQWAVTDTMPEDTRVFRSGCRLYGAKQTKKKT
jgi:hypothetical protein